MPELRKHGSPGITAFSEERERQQSIKGYLKLGDFGRAEELIQAGACYAEFAANEVSGLATDQPHPFWPWSEESWKPGETIERTLEKAGALLAAGYDALGKERVTASER